MNHREAFHDIENLPPQFYSTPASQCNQPLMQWTAIRSCSSAQSKGGAASCSTGKIQLLRWRCHENRYSLKSAKRKLKEVKARLYAVYYLITKWNLNHWSAFYCYRPRQQVGFEPLWQKCLIATGKSVRPLRAKDGNWRTYCSITRKPKLYIPNAPVKWMCVLHLSLLCRYTFLIQWILGYPNPIGQMPPTFCSDKWKERISEVQSNTTLYKYTSMCSYIHLLL